MSTDPETLEPKSSEQMAIDEGDAAHAFLSSEAGQSLVTRRNEDSFKRWMLSKTTAERESIFAEFKSFNDFIVEVELTVSKGKNARKMRTRREEVQAQDARVYGRPK